MASVSPCRTDPCGITAINLASPMWDGAFCWMHMHRKMQRQILLQPRQ